MNNHHSLYDKHTKELLKGIKRMSPILNNPNIKRIIEHKPQFNNSMVQHAMRLHHEIMKNNPTLRHVRKLQLQINNNTNIFHSKRFDQYLTNYRQIRNAISLFRKPLNNIQSSIGVIPNFYKLDSLRKLDGYSPYFDYIKNIRLKIDKLHGINYAPFKGNYLNAQSSIGIPGDDYTQDQIAKNKSISHNIKSHDNDKIDKIINEQANELSAKARYKIPKKIEDEKSSEKSNNIRRYTSTTLNYNDLSTHSWWIYISAIIVFINNVDQSCHTLDDVILLINNHSSEIIQAMHIAILWLNGLGF